MVDSGSRSSLKPYHSRPSSQQQAAMSTRDPSRVQRLRTWSPCWMHRQLKIEPLKIEQPTWLQDFGRRSTATSKARWRHLPLPILPPSADCHDDVHLVTDQSALRRLTDLRTAADASQGLQKPRATFILPA